MSEKLTRQQWDEIDRQLSESHVLRAVGIYRAVTGCGLGEAKSAVGNRFRERYPERWASFREVSEDD